MRRVSILGVIASLSACAAPPPAAEFVPSKKSAVELRSIQTRLVPADQDTTMRGVIGTLHDLGYRITRVESDAGTVSATRQTTLRMAVVVHSKDPSTSVVRANATIVGVGKEAQVDSPQFYELDFYEPLGVTMQRQVAELPNDVSAPDAVRPAAELNTIDERKAAAKAAVNPTETSHSGI